MLVHTLSKWAKKFAQRILTAAAARGWVRWANTTRIPQSNTGRNTINKRKKSRNENAVHNYFYLDSI
jgi:hypothetical protein